METSKELLDLSIDPVMAHNALIKTVETSGGSPIADPTNPFVMLLEAGGKSLRDTIESISLFERKFYPSMSRTSGDILYHISNADEINLFASPAKTKMRLYIALDDIYSNGIYDETRSTYTLKIPKNSFVTVDNTIFTFMSDIRIILSNKNNNLRSFVENIVTDDTVIFSNVGNIPSAIQKDQDNVDWLIADAPLAQVQVSRYEATATIGLPFKEEIPITDKYFFCVVEAEDPAMPGTYRQLNKIYTESVFDIDTPSVYISVEEDRLIFKIPQVFITSGEIQGIIVFTIYTTEGKKRMYFDKYSSDEFKLTVSRYKLDSEGAVAHNISILVDSKEVVDGGTNTIPLRDMKKKIIHRTTGEIDIPITEKQLMEASKLYGFTIAKALDTITNRVYIATNDAVDRTTLFSSTTITDIFNNRTVFKIIDPLLLQSTIKASTKFLIVKPGTKFILDGGVTRPLTLQEDIDFSNMDMSNAVTYMNLHNILVNPFYYVIDSDVNTVLARVYDTENPVMDMLQILSKNIAIKENVNINGFNIFRSKTGNGYDILFRLLGNEHFDGIAATTHVQFSLPIVGRNERIYFHSTLDLTKTQEYYPDETTPLHYIHIEMDDFINSLNEVMIINGATSSPVRLTPIMSEAEIVIYTTNMSIVEIGDVDALSFLGVDNSDVYVDGTPQDVVGLTKEKILFTPMTELEYIWRRVDALYTERRFLKHNVDIPLIYKENVYRVDPTTGCEYTILDTDGDGICDEIDVIIEHAAGDPVLDENNDPIMEYKAGDNILDENGLPIIDSISGVLRMVNILLLDYRYVHLNKEIYTTGVKDTEKLVLNILKNQMVDLNSKTLDNTTIFYKSRKNIDPVEDSTGRKHPYLVKPKVIVYIDKEAEDSSMEVSVLKMLIGNIINVYIVRKYIDLSEIEHAIETEIQNTVGVEVSNITPNNEKYLNIDNTGNRFTLAKKISDSFVIEYDYTLEVKPI